MGFEIDVLNGDDPGRDLYDDDDRARHWLTLPKDERDLRVVMEAIERGEGHSWCRALRKATRRLHLTTIWTDRPSAFAFQFEGEDERTWLVKILPSGTRVFDVVPMERSPHVASRGLLFRAWNSKDQGVGNKWLGAFQTFLERQGLLPTAPLVE